MSDNANTHTPPLPFTRILQEIGKPVTYHPTFAHALENDICAALFLSNFLFWEGKQHDPNGWIYKRQIDIYNETGLARSRQESARNKLKSLAILTEKLMGNPAKLHYRFDWERVDELLAAHFVKSGRPRSERKPPPPPEPDDQKETENQPAVLARMMSLFETVYTTETGLPFEWGKNKRARGKSFENLKRLKIFFAERLEFKEKQEFTKAGDAVPINFEPAYTDDDVCNSFEHFLAALPAYHRKTNLTPELLYSNANKIILDIKAESKKQNGSNPNPSTQNGRPYGVD